MIFKLMIFKFEMFGIFKSGVFKLTPRPGPTSSILRFLLVSNKPIKYFKISIRPEYHQLLWSFSSGM